MTGADRRIADILDGPAPDSPPSAEPADELVTSETLAAWLGVSTIVANTMAREGTIPRRAHGGACFPLRQCVLAYITHLRQGTGNATVALKIAQRQKIELQMAETRGELVDAKDVLRTWTATLTDLRSAMLAVPSRLGQRLPHLTAHDVDAADREIRAALAEASEDGDD